MQADIQGGRVQQNPFADKGSRDYYGLRPIPAEAASLRGRPSSRNQADPAKVIEEVAQKEGMRIVYLNPRSESEALIRKGRDLGLEIRDTCSIVAIAKSVLGV